MTWLLGLLPTLLEWGPHIAGAGGVLASVAGFLPGLRKVALIALAGALAIAIGAWLWERGQHHKAEAALVADRAAAWAEALRQERAAAALSDELVIQQAIAFGATARKADGYDRKIEAAAPGELERVGSCGVRDIIKGSPC